MGGSSGGSSENSEELGGGSSVSSSASGSSSASSSSTSGGQAKVCNYACNADPTTGITNCSGPIFVTSFQSPMMTGQIDMTGFNELEVQFEVCSPTGWTFHLGDAPANNGWGGDNGTTSNDAEIHLTGTSLLIYRNDQCPADPPLMQEVPNFVAGSGCTTRTLVLRDAQLQSATPQLDITYPCLLSINPPSDPEGVPDARWHWGLNRTVADSSRNGTGAVAASFCLR